ncbi:putative cystathionine gamma-synthase protein [Mycena sanguinolenta]|uniref:Putative cystathionine gamma-synthase protein n=1 Tax=Mycena sanguinolenta TaxID=230812 RepID=A0A8H7D161_9AGAR|nr:putative cystathionine gamma-synthase protein [Mycena sanguinolenta]
MAKAPGIIGVLQNVGTGVSARLSEYLLTQADTLVEVPFNVPGDGDVSVEKSKRFRPRPPQNKAIVPDDIYFHATGMAAIYRLHVALTHVRKGPVVALGALFHGTYHLLSEFPDGFKHFGQCNAQSGVTDKLEPYLQEEAKVGHKVSYIFVEFPSDPILVSVDLKRLRQLEEAAAT